MKMQKLAFFRAAPAPWQATSPGGPTQKRRLSLLFMLHERQNRPQAVLHKTFCISDQSPQSGRHPLHLPC